MFEQIIYTRCSNGRDLFKNGQPKLGSGFKAFSFTENLVSDEVDISFLEDTIKKEIPYDKRAAIKKDTQSVPNFDDFIDDAFLYYVPAYGSPFIMDFSVRIYIQGVSDRPGNFINHAFIGEINDYPCKYIDSNSFTAKNTDESLYYNYKGSDVPEFLSPISSLQPNPIFDFENIGAFIKEGNRATILKNAVWFILKQFELPFEQRKYIIINAIESEIEHWIAAIDYAFSPNIAGVIPFTTRLNRPTMENKYNITPDGKFSRNPSASTRNRAMIVGVDTRDGVGMRDVRSIPNSPYVLLNDIKADASDIIHPYFSLITEFNDEHKYFTHYFLHCDNNKISFETIQQIYDAFKILISDFNRISDTALIKAINTVTENKITQIPNWDRIEEKLSTSLKNGSVSLPLVKCVISINANGGRQNDSLMAELCDFYANKLFSIAQVKSADQKLRDYWISDKVRDIFARTKYHSILNSKIVELAPEKLSFNFYAMKPFESNSLATVFFKDIYFNCMKEAHIGFDNERVLNFVAKELCKLLTANTENRKTVRDILRYLKTNFKNAISLLRGVTFPQSSALKELIVLDFGEDIVEVKNEAELTDLCKKKLLSTNQKEIEYFLAEYYIDGQFTPEVLINRVLSACFVPSYKKGDIIPYPYGVYFFHKCIEKNSETCDYVDIISVFSSSKIFISDDIKVGLLKFIDDKLINHIPGNTENTESYSASANLVLSADEIIKYDSTHICENSCLISLYSKARNKQATQKYMVSLAKASLHLPSKSYLEKLNSVLSNEEFTCEIYLCLFALFEQDKTDNNVLDFIFKILTKHPSKSLFFELSEYVCIYSKYNEEESKDKIFVDIFGTDYKENDRFINLINDLHWALKTIYKDTYADSADAAIFFSKSVKGIKELSAFYHDVYGLAVNGKSKASDPKKMDNQRTGEMDTKQKAREEKYTDKNNTKASNNRTDKQDIRSEKSADKKSGVFNNPINNIKNIFKKNK
jgi:hypothetical protein